ncbi:MAG: hypothetical protein V4507_08705 [Verrucomicrobiota bacterium]
MKKIILFVALLLGSILDLRTETKEGPEKPEAPFVAEPADYSAWTITVSKQKLKETGSKTSPGGTAPSTTPEEVWDSRIPTQVENFKTEKIKREVYTWSKGQKSENWVYDRYFFSQYQTGEIDVLLVDHASVNLEENPWNAKGYIGTDWITGDSFVRREKINGQDCFYFVLTLPPKKGAKIIEPLEAYIRVSDKFPVRVIRQGLTLDFRQSPAPSHLLTLPEAFDKALQEFKQRAGIP